MTQTGSSDSDLPLVSPSRGNESVVSKSKVQIAVATLSDLDAVAALLTHSFYEFQTWNTWLAPLIARGIREDLRHRFQSSPLLYTCLLAYVNEPSASLTSGPTQKQIVGTIELSRPSPRIAYPSHLYLSNLAVQAEFRRQGVGRQLLEACEVIVQTTDYAGLCLHVLVANQPAQSLYRACGFRRITHRPSFWSWTRLTQRYVYVKDKVKHQAVAHSPTVSPSSKGLKTLQ